jgi:hypothetical protein
MNQNYELLISNISSWMAPKALLFVHIFVHKDAPYHFVRDCPYSCYCRRIAALILFLVSTALTVNPRSMNPN